MLTLTVVPFSGELSIVKVPLLSRMSSRQRSSPIPVPLSPLVPVWLTTRVVACMISSICSGEIGSPELWTNKVFGAIVPTSTALPFGANLTALAIRFRSTVRSVHHHTCRSCGHNQMLYHAQHNCYKTEKNA